MYKNAVCVKSCPKTVDDKIECPPGDKYADKCDVKHVVATTSVADLCWPHYSTLTPDQKANWKLVMRGLERNAIFAHIMNLTTAYRAVIFSMLTAFVLCIVYIYFMSIFAEYVAWAIIFFTQLSFIVLSMASFYSLPLWKEKTMKLQPRKDSLL